MKLSLLSFSLMSEYFTRQMKPETLCRICKENGIEKLDLLDYELKFLHADKLKSAMKEQGISCGSVIVNIDFLCQPEQADEMLKRALEQCKPTP